MFSSNASSALGHDLRFVLCSRCQLLSLVSHQGLLAGHVLFQLRRSFLGLLQLLIQSLLNVIHGTRVSQPESSSTSGSVTRACSYSQLPAVLEVLSRSFQTHRTPGQDLEVHQNVGSTLCNSSALELIFPPVSLAVSLLSQIQVLILRLVPNDEFVQFLFECC